MVKAPVPDRGVNHAIGRECHNSTDGSTGEDVPPVVELIDRQSAGNQGSYQDGRVDGDQLPHGRVVVREDLELRIEVQIQVDEASEGGSGVTGRERLERIIDLVLVARADLRRVVYLIEAGGVVRGALLALGVAGQADVGLADVEEVGAQAADQALEEDLEDGGRDERVQQAEDAVVDVPERPHPDLHEQDHDDGDHGRQERRQPDRDDLLAQRVGELRVHYLAVGGVGHGERAGGCRWGFVDLE